MAASNSQAHYFVASLRFERPYDDGDSALIRRQINMQENWRKLVRYVNPRATMLAVLAALVTCSPGQSSAQQHEFVRFRNALIDYFKRQNYLPVIVNRGYKVGDVINVDGVNFYA
ncbi:MAG TPA: hypothetical protein VHT93_15555, partial [Pseudolabrys sp.]|nr:hypothetical protein [Pseudolabrys sp.]